MELIDKLFKKGKYAPKIFCISMQRTGTTSVGDFFEYHGYKRSGWPDVKKYNWGKKWFDGDYESILNSKAFFEKQMFEDSIGSFGDGYKFLFHRFPNAKFILLTRDKDKWFNSMLSHSNGKTLGNTFMHCCIYNRESEYYNFIGERHNYNSVDVDNLMELTEEHRKHYTQIYKNRNRQALDFFKCEDPNNTRFIHLKLEDIEKWKKLGAFFGFTVKDDFEMHSNSSKRL